MRAINTPLARKAFWEKINRDHTADKIEKALSQIKEPYQSVLRMHYFEGLGFSAIMARINRSASVMRVYHSKGMYRLVELLYPELDTPLDLLAVRHISR